MVGSLAQCLGLETLGVGLDEPQGGRSGRHVLLSCSVQRTLCGGDFATEGKTELRNSGSRMTAQPSHPPGEQPLRIADLVGAVGRAPLHEQVSRNRRMRFPTWRPRRAWRPRPTGGRRRATASAAARGRDPQSVSRSDRRRRGGATRAPWWPGQPARPSPGPTLSRCRRVDHGDDGHRRAPATVAVQCRFDHP